MGCCMDAVPVPAGAEANPPRQVDTRRPPSPRPGQTLNRLEVIPMCFLRTTSFIYLSTYEGEEMTGALQVQ